jgi:hypothetical protein
VETAGFSLKFDGPKFILNGNQQTGEVKWLMSQNAAKRDAYREKYSKFSWSSHFGFNATGEKDKPPADQALVFRRIADGVCATRAPAGVTEGKLLDDGVETKWFAMLGDWRFDVVSRVRLIGEYEERTHRIVAPGRRGGEGRAPGRFVFPAAGCGRGDGAALAGGRVTSASRRSHWRTRTFYIRRCRISRRSGNYPPPR